MAQWTNIPTDRIEPGKPIRAIDGLALRDNPIAIAEGAAGAPKITENAMNVNSIHGNRLRNGTVTTDKIANNNVTAQKLATGGNENNWVRSRIATSTAGAVGTYAFVTRIGTTGSTSWNGTIAGSSLRRASVGQSGMEYNESAALSGTWRIMGPEIRFGIQNPTRGTLALRIS